MQVFMVIGCPGSGKSWVCDQLAGQFHHVRHDLFSTAPAYVAEIAKRSRDAVKPLLIETPFSISQIKDPLEALGLNVTPVFIQEDHKVIRERYWGRERKLIPPGHLTRQETYRQRAALWHAFQGTSSQVLAYLRQHAL